mgnify:CR=1 FL=1
MTDNYFLGCPPMMEDGRLFTDYRSSQVREEIFRFRNCTPSENEARTYRIENGEEILDEEWNHLSNTRACFVKENCFHQHPTTRVSTYYNNAELLAYNGDIPAPACNRGCHDYRTTSTKGAIKGREHCVKRNIPGNGYPTDRCPKRCAKSKRLLPDQLYVIDGKY